MVDVMEVLRFLLTSLIAILPSLFIYQKNKVEATKILSESKQIDSDTTNDRERLLLEAKKVEVEMAAQLIKSAGDLIANYRDMVDTFSSKFNAQEEKLNALSVELHTEVRKREKLERNWKELLVGVKKLLAQLEENKIIPVWKPKVDIDIIEE